MKNKVKHVAIIMDGNRRWAAQNGVSVPEGHFAGAQNVVQMMESIHEFEFEYITLYSFSTENWKRSENEVSALMNLLCDFLDQYEETMVRNRLRLLTMGRVDELPSECMNRLSRVMETTAADFEKTIILALNYGGRAEITDAVKHLCGAIQNGSLDPNGITEETISEALYLPGIPEPDLMIRTGGDIRVSNFLLWQISYAELYFTPVLWPDFKKEELHKALDSFETKQRKFGGNQE